MTFSHDIFGEEFENYNLADIAVELVRSFPQISGLYLFGSRRYRTRSPRSDVDVLVVSTEHIRAVELVAVGNRICPALDLFIVEGGKGISSGNQSYVQADSLGELVNKLDAVEFWSIKAGPIVGADVDWKFRVQVGVEFVPSVLLSSETAASRWARSTSQYFRTVQALHLPSRPFIGDNVLQAGEFIVSLIRELPNAARDLESRGKGSQIDLQTEYDLQNLFYLAVKPWLPGLGRNETTIMYDGATKSADFSLFDSQLVIEMKHVKSAGTKAAVVKTLEGLKRFYVQNANIRVLLFVILFDSKVSVDDSRWEADYSARTHDNWVQTVLLEW